MSAVAAVLFRFTLLAGGYDILMSIFHNQIIAKDIFVRNKKQLGMD